MKIKFRSFSKRALGKYRPGQEAELEEKDAVMFLNLGLADPVKPKVERIIHPTPENEAVNVESPAEVKKKRGRKKRQ
jgi:hypothetical protein